MEQKEAGYKGICCVSRRKGIVFKIEGEKMKFSTIFWSRTPEDYLHTSYKGNTKDCLCHNVSQTKILQFPVFQNEGINEQTGKDGIEEK